jgi:hypothetical protein
MALCAFMPFLTAADETPELHRLLLELVYFYRAYLLGDELYFGHGVDFRNNVERVLINFVKRFEHYYGVNNSFYNLHLLLHLRWIREIHGNMTRFSAFPFETHYGVQKSLMTEGTTSLGKQVMRGVAEIYWGRRERHTCLQGLHITTKKKCTAHRNDCIIATTYHSFIEVFELNGDEVKGYKIVTHEFLPNITPDPQCWKKVGVFGFDKVSDEIQTIRRDDIYGKGVICDGVITSVPLQVLRDH